MTTDKQLAFPGDEVGVSEEFIPGPGTYEKGGRIYAIFFGELELDKENMTATVHPHNPPVVLQVNDIVVGRVYDLRSSMAVVNILKREGTTRAITGEKLATVHISKISDDYVEDIRDAYRLGDTVRALVVQTEPSVQLTTAREDLGVISARCVICQLPLARQDDKLHCTSCDRKQLSKLAQEYGDYQAN